MAHKKRRKQPQTPADPKVTAGTTSKAVPKSQDEPAPPATPEKEPVPVIDIATYKSAYCLSLVPIWSILIDRLSSYPNNTITMQIYNYAYFSDRDEAGKGKIDRRTITPLPAVLSISVRGIEFDQHHPESPQKHVLIKGSVLSSNCNNAESKSTELQPEAQFANNRGFSIFRAKSDIEIICNLEARIGAVVSVTNHKGRYFPYVPADFHYHADEPSPPHQ